MTTPSILVSFISDAAKRKYKPRDAKSHAWKDKYHAVLQIESYSETGDGQVVLCNDLGQIWWVSNRDVLIINHEEFHWSDES